jgi:hypothetical protein
MLKLVEHKYKAKNLCYGRHKKLIQRKRMRQTQHVAYMRGEEMYTGIQ